ncbi:hypothetical protein ACEPAI_9738 [Sanghuangporus weigelae]
MVVTQPQTFETESPEPCDDSPGPGDQGTGMSSQGQAARTITDNSASLRRSGRTKAPSAYVKRLTAGEGTQTQWKRDGIIPKGMRTVVEEDDTVAGVWDDYDKEYDFAGVTSEEEGLEPRNLQEARRLPEWSEWERAIQEELAALRAAGTWELAEAPKGANIVGSKWVFKVKRDSAGSIVRRKARLVAQGFSQVEGIDYFDTYAPVAKLASIRTILAILAQLDLELEQIDVKSAYLNGELEENEVVYMHHPPGYKPIGTEERVLKLRKTLYGLKQSGRRWYQKFTSIMVDRLGFSRCDVDQAIYFRHLPPDLIVVAVSVDDCTLAASRSALIDKFKSDFSKYVEITDLGPIHWLLGIQIKRDRELRTLSLSQTTYINSVLRRYGLENARDLTSPMDPNVKLDSSQSPQTAQEIAEMCHIPYREALGSLRACSGAVTREIARAKKRDHDLVR